MVKDNYGDFVQGSQLLLSLFKCDLLSVCVCVSVHFQFAGKSSKLWKVNCFPVISRNTCYLPLCIR